MFTKYLTSEVFKKISAVEKHDVIRYLELLIY